MSETIRQAVVLAGGLGTRLGELTAETPKPLLPVGGRPFIEWVLANLAAQGVQEVILAIGYRAEAFDAWRADPDRMGLVADLEIRMFVEDEPLGTGGALPLIRERLDPAFFVLNGDTLFDAPLSALGSALAEVGARGAIALRSVSDVARYGEVQLSAQEAGRSAPTGRAAGRIAAFAEKGRSGPGLINGGVYALTRGLVEGVESPSSLERDVLPGLAREGSLVGLPCEGFFIDIGVPASFQEAQTSVPIWWAEERATE